MSSDRIFEKSPTKTKYHDIIRPKAKTPRYQHIGLVRYRTEEPEWDDDGITIPQNIGRHVLDEDYRAPRTSPPFMCLQPNDIWFPLVPVDFFERVGTSISGRNQIRRHPANGWADSTCRR